MEGFTAMLREGMGDAEANDTSNGPEKDKDNQHAK